jgi:hypothetical protein
MDRLLGFCVAIGLTVVLVLTLCLRNPIRLYGYELLRGYQRLIISMETVNWPVLEDQHFIVRYQRGDEDGARMVLQEAERVYSPLGNYFDSYPGKKTTILVYPDRHSLNRIFGWGADESAMGVYWAGAIRVLAPRAWMEDMPAGQQERVFRTQGPVAHEYVHLLVDCKTGGNYPRWLTEGLAQYGEETVAGGVQPDLDRPAVVDLTMKQLEKGFDDPVWQDYSYAVAKGLVSHLIGKYGDERINRLLDALGHGQSMDEAFAETYGITVEEFIRSYNT